jgi:hypothetical protein
MVTRHKTPGTFQCFKTKLLKRVCTSVGAASSFAIHSELYDIA